MSSYFRTVPIANWNLESAIESIIENGSARSQRDACALAKKELKEILDNSKRPEKIKAARALLAQRIDNRTASGKATTSGGSSINCNFQHASVGKVSNVVNNTNVTSLIPEKRKLENEVENLLTSRPIINPFEDTEAAAVAEETLHLPETPAIRINEDDVDIGRAPGTRCSALAREFYIYKKEALKVAQRNALYFDRNLHDILALSHVLLLKRSQYSTIQKQSMGEYHLNSFYNNFLDTHCKYMSSVELQLKTELEQLVKPLKRPGADVQEVLRHLLERMKSLDRNCFEYRILRCLQNILEEFPDVCVEKLGEHNLICLVIDPILRALFSSRAVRLRWPEVNAIERISRTKRIERPDAMLTTIDSNVFGKSLMFGEVKPCNADSNLKAMDLLRLAVFGKDAIDVNKWNKVLLFQTIGPSITFYVQALIDEGAYVMCELHQIQLPQSISDLPHFLGQLDSIMDIYKTLQSIQPELDSERWQKLFRETLGTPTFRRIVNRSGSSRQCIFTF